MDTLQTALKLVTQNCYMASIDAYCSVPIHKSQRKFLRFKWRGKLWQFNCMPNGLPLAPRKFTKLLKLIFVTLREVTCQLPFWMILSFYLSLDLHAHTMCLIRCGSSFPGIHCPPRKISVGTHSLYSVPWGHHRLLK